MSKQLQNPESILAAAPHSAISSADRQQVEHDAKPVPRDLAQVTEVLNEAWVTIRDLEQGLSELESRQTVAKAGQTCANKHYTTEQLMTMVSTYIDSPLQMLSLTSMLRSGDPAQQQEAQRFLLIAKRERDAQRIHWKQREWLS